MKIYDYERNYNLEKVYWWFVGVRKMVHKLLSLTKKKNSLGKVLDIGCGTGALLDKLAPKCEELWGLDISPEAIEFCKKRGHKNLILGSAGKIPFADNYFDVVTAIGVIEHIPDEKGFLTSGEF